MSSTTQTHTLIRESSKETLIANTSGMEAVVRAEAIFQLAGISPYLSLNHVDRAAARTRPLLIGVVFFEKFM